MAAVFAHDLYGRTVYRGLSEAMRQVIREHKDCYYLGLQGPDPLFFYRPKGDNAVRLLGKRIHTRTGEEFFTDAIRTVKEERNAGHENTARMLEAYLLGFCCHYALDSGIHGWINETQSHTAFSHTQLETELDRRLLLREGHDPLRTERAYHLRNTRETREAGAKILSVSPGLMGECIVSMRLINRMLGDSFEWFKEAICLSCSGVRDSDLLRGMFLRRRPAHGIEPYVDTMERMYDRLVPTGVAMEFSLWECMKKGEKLPKRFGRSFDGYRT